VRFGDVAIDGADIYWVESRPAENGRSVIVCFSSGGMKSDVLDAPFSARSRVHEYGGGAFTVHKGTLYFTNFEDQQIYRKNPGSVPYPITSRKNTRNVDLIIDERRSRIICIQEAHTKTSKEPINTIMSIDMNGEGTPQVLISGNDFYSSPRLSPDGKRLAWLTWNHANMPWYGTELWVADVGKDGDLERNRKVAGGISESIFQPEWAPDDILYFVSDVNGWWNIYRYRNGKIETVTELEAEFGVPHWVFGLSTYGFVRRDILACTYDIRGVWYLASVDLKTKEIEQKEISYTDITHLKTMGIWIVFQGGSPTESLSVVRYNISSGKTEVLQQASESSVDPGYLSEPEAIEFGTTNDLKAYGFFYPPRNKDYEKPSKELPPLIVITHGGPTSCSYTSLDLMIQFWTSRGFAILDVNYGGSTGFGRPYRERLNGNWGVVDVDDCVNGALYLVDKGLVDGERLIIRGGSAGGYTTLAALAFRDFFKAGASYYGVSDLEALTYRERSPLNYAERLSAPVIFFQGLDDRVVPPDQSEKMVNALRDKGIPVAYLAFAGEQHGFRKAENVKRSLEAELYFYSRVFDFELSEDIPPVRMGSDLEIRN
jgi:dipeptidyl aminopeptidase/acylaminoacyl peptidase